MNNVATNKLKETDLYVPLKNWLEAQDYKVRGEVGKCDVGAENNGEFIAIECKLRPSLTLLAQAAERQEYADSVYIALPATVSGKSWNRKFSYLVRRLGLGLISVVMLKTKTRVEVLIHPVNQPGKRNRPGKKAALIREIHGRDLDLTPGGLPGNKITFSAYRQRSIRLAVWLEKLGHASPVQLRKLGAPKDTGNILSRNLFGWFDRVERGIYTLNPAGKQALSSVPELYTLYKSSTPDHGRVSPKQVSSERAY